MKPGFYDGIPNAEYHGGPGISKSGLDLIARSPLHYRAVVDAANDNQREPTPAQMLGTAFHCLLLEPDVFVREYCLGLRQADVPDAIGDRDTLVAMVAKLNETRLPKLSASGTKDELVARIMDADPSASENADALQAMKLAELKAAITAINETRPGLLPTTGTMSELSEILRAAGHQVTLWADVKAQWLANNGHRTVLDQETWDQLHAMRDAVMAHPAARALLSMPGGVAERSVYWVDQATGELCRCRPDWWVVPRGIIVDVKTTEDASPEGFARSVADWRYHVQHPMYLDGINEARRQVELANASEEFPAPVPPEARSFVFLAVEKKAPHAVAVYSLESPSIMLGRALYRRDLGVYSQCQATGVWPGYGDTIQALSVPAWHLNAHAQLLENAA
ncbi:exonuclease [Achromobacter phage Mano]|uniref:Exonuclease n=1 Tax=Achromobacter phage Mano TaxID=2767570 RepID=A0A7L8G6D3_9CAUD|nr:exonuclease VIII [Achromobacter phage Mano]QOE32767.1 exonuclease [Achromobacter phage Mano]